MNLKAHYIRLYKKADEILKQPDNPCQIQKDSEGNTTCVRSRFDVPNSKYGMRHNVLCCEGCKHHGPNGCTVMALSCKLGWCSFGPAISGMKVESHPMFVAIKALNDEARTLNVPMYFRKSLEQTFP